MSLTRFIFKASLFYIATRPDTLQEFQTQPFKYDCHPAFP